MSATITPLRPSRMPDDDSLEPLDFDRYYTRRSKDDSVAIAASCFAALIGFGICGLAFAAGGWAVEAVMRWVGWA